MKKYIPYVIAVIIGSGISIGAQNFRGTPNQIRVRTDATGALLALAVSSTTPISQPTLFSNTNLRVDASNNLVIVCDTCGGGGGAPVDATYITQTPNSTLTNEQPISALDTGVLFGTTTTGVITSLGQGTAGQFLIAGTPPAFGMTLDLGTITVDTPLKMLVNENNGGVNFINFEVIVTPTDNGAGSAYAYWHGGGGNFIFRTSGVLTLNNCITWATSQICNDGLYPNGQHAIFSTTPSSPSFGTSPVLNADNAFSFTVDVGTGGTASTGSLTMPAATNGWNCLVTDVTSADSFVTSQTASTTNSIAVKNYSRTTGIAIAWNANDILGFTCTGF